jgi:NAD(P)-dependent dehydrogenase (short-subunit alcohol dehydrogenase family)
MGTAESFDFTADGRLVSTIVVVGGAGTIGRKLVPALRANGHRVIVAGRTSGDVHVDLTSHCSIETMYQRVDGVDGVVSIAAHGALDDFATLTVEALHDNMRAKFYGQADLVLTGQHYCNSGASFTLTTKIEDSVDVFDEQFPGMRALPMNQLIKHYLHCIQGNDTGLVIRAYDAA